MTNEQAKEAYFSGVPVISDGIEYECITALIYRKDDYNNTYLSLELLDKNKNCVVIALPYKVNLKREDVNEVD